MINCTPHPIVLAGPAGDVTIPPSGTVARVTMTPTTIGEAAGLPIVANVPGEITGLPDPVAGVRVIVSGLVRGVLVGRPDVIAPDTGPTARRSATGQIEAVRGFVGEAAGEWWALRHPETSEILAVRQAASAEAALAAWHAQGVIMWDVRDVRTITATSATEAIAWRDATKVRMTAIRGAA